MLDIVDILREAYHTGTVLKEENEVLKGENETLRTENASLKERLTHYEKPQLDSQNSSTPHSAESLKAQAIRRICSLLVPSGRKTGGQVGHKGVTLVKSEKADDVQAHIPSYCKECGHSMQLKYGLPCRLANRKPSLHWSKTIPLFGYIKVSV